MGSRVQFEAMLAAMDLHRIHPVIDRTFDMADIAEAYAFLECGQHVGKIVINICEVRGATPHCRGRSQSETSAAIGRSLRPEESKKRAAEDRTLS